VQELYRPTGTFVEMFEAAGFRYDGRPSYPGSAKCACILTASACVSDRRCDRAQTERLLHVRAGAHGTVRLHCAQQAGRHREPKVRTCARLMRRVFFRSLTK